MNGGALTFALLGVFSFGACFGLWMASMMFADRYRALRGRSDHLDSAITDIGRMTR